MGWNIDKLKSYIIYGILDQKTGLYVYIGSTKQRLMDRRNGHSAGHGNSDLNNWIELKRKELERIKFVIIYECDIKNETNLDLEYWEYFYIKKFKKEGHVLFNITLREIPYPPKKEIINILKEGKYNNAWIANELYKPLPRKSSIAKFRNKLQNIDGRGFTDDEIKKIEEILK